MDERLDNEERQPIKATHVRRIDSIGDQMRGVVTYQLNDYHHITLSARAVERYGLEELLRSEGIELPTGRVAVHQRGQQVGTVPATFDPTTAKSRSFFMDIRPGDFVREDSGWKANPMLGPGDLSAIPGFVWSDDPNRAGRDLEDDRAILRQAIATPPDTLTR